MTFRTNPMAASKSPFLIFQEFLSPLLCEDVIEQMDVTVPDINIEGKPQPSTRHNKVSEIIIFERLRPLVNIIEKYYDAEYRGTEKLLFEWYPQGSTGELVCDSSDYVSKKWVRTRDRDLTAILFLTDHRETVPFDPDYEVSGGKLEFPQHGFGFNPERGTLILFPATPHFINANAQINAGDLFQVRIHMATKRPYLYQPRDFPGNYTTWFTELMG